MFGYTLKKLRTQHGLSQQKLSQELNVAQSTIGNWESGTREPDFVTTKKIADYFHVTTDYLLGRSDSPSPQLLHIPDELKDVQVAFHRGEFEDLTQDEVDAIAVLAKTLKEQRKKKEDGK